MLQNELNALIKSYHPNICPLDAVYDLAKSLGQKEKTAERRLNRSENKLVETVKNNKHFIVGYRWVGIIIPKIPIRDNVEQLRML